MAARTAELPDYFSFTDEPSKDVHIALAFLRGLVLGPFIPLVLHFVSVPGLPRIL